MAESLPGKSSNDHNMEAAEKIASYKSEFGPMKDEISEETSWNKEKVEIYMDGIREFIAAIRQDLSIEQYPEKELQLTSIQLFKHLYDISKYKPHELKLLAYPGLALKDEIDAVKKWNDSKIREFLDVGGKGMRVSTRFSSVFSNYTAIDSMQTVASTLEAYLYSKIKNEKGVSREMKVMLGRSAGRNLIEFDGKFIKPLSRREFEIFEEELDEVDEWNDTTLNTMEKKLQEHFAKAVSLSDLKDPKQKRLMEAAFYRGLYQRIIGEVKISDALANKIDQKAKIDVNFQGKRKEVMDDLALGLSSRPKKKKFIDPLLVDPIDDKPVKKPESAPQTFDQTIEEMYHDFLDEDIELEESDLDPFQEMVLKIIFIQIIEPIYYIKESLREKNQDASWGSKLGAEFEIAFNDLGRRIALRAFKMMKSKEMSIADVRDIASGLLGLMDDPTWQPILSSLPECILWRGTLANTYSKLEFNYDFEEKIKEEAHEYMEDTYGMKPSDLNASVIASILNLSESATKIMERVVKRKPLAVAKERSPNPKNHRRLQLLIHFIVNLKNKGIFSKTEMAIVDFSIGILSRLKGDKELAELGRAMRMPLMYVFSIPGFKRYVDSNPELKRLQDSDPAFFFTALDFVLPETEPLDEKLSTEYKEKYKYTTGLIEKILKEKSKDWPVEARYALAFVLENIDSAYGSNKKFDVGKLLKVAINIMKPYEKNNKQFVEAAAHAEELT
ncbi:MAG: hypothetical protein O3B47_00465 [bacterium]|nr:hypothetical protein [bacterium]